MSKQSLPAEFADLEPLVAEWALPTLKERLRKRTSSNMDELKAFYEVISARMEAVMEFLTGYPPKEEEMPADVLQLVYLAKSFMEVGLAVELFHAPDEPDVFDFERMEAVL
ncbi:MAG: hypothetical protein J4A00_09580 [Gammaproteobacteria bacterium]|nr:hypothetical protein [Gammaproteobacteria bacterium]